MASRLPIPHLGGRQLLQNQTEVLQNETQVLLNQTEVLQNQTQVLLPVNQTEVLQNQTQVLQNQTQVLQNQTEVLQNQTQTNQTAEQRLIAAILDPNVSVFELTEDIVLTYHLPEITAFTGEEVKKRKFAVFSSEERYAIDGAKKWRGFFMTRGNGDLFFLNVILRNFRVEYPGLRNEWSGVYLSGAAIGYVGGGKVRVRRCVLQDNWAGDAGGAIYIQPGESFGGTLILRRSTVINNFAANGGGIYFRGKRLRIEDSSIDYNDVSNIGGGINVQSATRISIMRSTITGNSAGNTIGGLYVNFPFRSHRTVFIKDSEISTNIEGGLFFRGVKQVMLCRTAFGTNSATFPFGPKYNNLQVEAGEARWTTIIASPSFSIPDFTYDRKYVTLREVNC